MDGMNDSVIEARDLRRRYGGAHGYEAVRGVSFTVRRGELFALLGTNGAGKTSTLEVLEGISMPSGGTVRVLGRHPYTDRKAVRPRIGVMLQDAGFPSDLTVSEMVRLWAGIVSRPRPVDEALELVDLHGRRDVPVRALSGGERRRLDLALAVLSHPEVLFLDEPTTGLDPESRQRTWGLVRDLLAGGTTIMLTTHYLEEAEVLADRLAIMHGGRIATSGTPTEIAAAHPALISFELPTGVSPAHLPAIGGAAASATGTRVTFRVGDLQTALTELLTWANGRQIVLPGLDARSASLEEAFLAVAAAPHDTTPVGVA
jgi:ABC-2 type transport system ATP-binding protein